MKIVMISGAAPPAEGSHATRVFAFVKALTAQGGDVSVVTVRWPEAMKKSSSLYKRLLDLADVIETDGGLLRRMADAARTPQAVVKNRKRGSRKIRAFIRSLMIPDSFLSWIPSAVRASLRIPVKAGRGLVISSGAPFSSHVVGWLVSVWKRVPLVLDYGDPWVYEPGRPRNRLRLIFELPLERRILSRASAICVTTEETADLYRAKFSGIKAPIYVLPMGYDGSDYAALYATAHVPIAVTEAQRNEYRFVYAGRINDEYRTLRTLQNVLDSPTCEEFRIIFEFYGSEHTRVRSDLSKFVDLGLVKTNANLDHVAYIDALINSDGIVVLGNNNYVQIPGKIAHSLAARRPILYFPNVSRLEDDPSLNLMRRVIKVGLFVIDGPDAFSQCMAFIRSGARVEVDEEELRKLEWGCVGGLLYSIARKSVRSRFCEN